MKNPEFTSSWLPAALGMLRRNARFALAIAVGPKGHPWYGRRALIGSTVSLDGNDLLTCENVSVLFKSRSAIRLKIASIGGEAEILVLPFNPPEEAWIFGAGHIAQELAPLTTRLGWRTVVCDDRAEYASCDRFPDANEIHVGDFADLAGLCAQRRAEWVILLTRGHQHDERILNELEHAHCRYVGMIGSKRRVAAVRERLSKRNIVEGFLDRLHAPIGLPIGADSPTEIAVSILAEMISVRRDPVLKETLQNTMADTSSVSAVWEKVESVLANDRPVVLATIIDRRGATPRGLGAQMAIFADGSIAGTIGGGCGEEEIKSAARRLMLSNSATDIIDVDLTGDPASESAADICGGRYAVLLELMRS